MVQAKAAMLSRVIHNDPSKSFIKRSRSIHVTECLSKAPGIQRWITRVAVHFAEIYQRLILTQTMVQIARTPALTGDLCALPHRRTGVQLGQRRAKSIPSVLHSFPIREKNTIYPPAALSSAILYFLQCLLPLNGLQMIFAHCGRHSGLTSPKNITTFPIDQPCGL